MKNRNSKLIISLVIAVVIAIILLFVGFAISGFDVLAWFGSKYAITLYIVVGIFVSVWLVLFLKERNSKL